MLSRLLFGIFFYFNAGAIVCGWLSPFIFGRHLHRQQHTRKRSHLGGCDSSTNNSGLFRVFIRYRRNLARASLASNTLIGLLFFVSAPQSDNISLQDTQDAYAARIMFDAATTTTKCRIMFDWVQFVVGFSYLVILCCVFICLPLFFFLVSQLRDEIACVCMKENPFFSRPVAQSRLDSNAHNKLSYHAAFAGNGK